MYCGDDVVRGFEGWKLATVRPWEAQQSPAFIFVTYLSPFFCAWSLAKNFVDPLGKYKFRLAPLDLQKIATIICLCHFWELAVHWGFTVEDPADIDTSSSSPSLRQCCQRGFPFGLNFMYLSSMSCPELFTTFTLKKYVAIASLDWRMISAAISVSKDEWIVLNSILNTFVAMWWPRHIGAIELAFQAIIRPSIFVSRMRKSNAVNMSVPRLEQIPTR